MSEYKRWISYIYYYENGSKKNNIGYVRVETLGQKTKITLHINVLSVTEPMQTYLFVRKNNEIKGINIGDVLVDKGVGRGVFSTNSASIADSGYSISDIGGIIIYYDDSKFFASEWDDEPVDINKFIVTGKERMNIPEVNNMDSEPEQGSVDQSEENAELEPEPIEIPVREPESEPEPVEIPVREPELEPEPKETPVREPETEPEPIEIPVRNPETEPEPVEIPVREPEKTPGPVQEPEPMPVRTAPAAEQDENYSEENIPDIITQSLKDDTQSESAATNEAAYSSTGSRNFGGIANGMDSSSVNANIAKAADYILNTFPQMYPFEDDEMLKCVRIEPQDIGRLPIDAWSLANNSFLLRGYYSYRHLMLLKSSNNNKTRYLIGVPGVYHNKDDFVAKMFGFELFKPMKKTSDVHGEFGYWMILVSDINENL